ncbi:MAG: hypothetical protein AAGG01_04715 [Planctomycetota bacterium]
MNAPSARSGSPLRTVTTLSVLALGVLVVAALIRTGQTAARASEAVARIKAQLAADRHLREAPHGETIEGQAFEQYARALQEVDRFLTNHSTQKSLWSGTLGNEESLALVREAVEAFAHLRRGASSRDAIRRVDWSVDADQASLRFGSIRNLASLGVLRAEELLGNGQPVEAVKVLLDVQQLGADMLSSPRPIECAIGGPFLTYEHMARILEGSAYGDLTDEAKQLWIDGMRKISAGVIPTTRIVSGWALRLHVETTAAFKNGSFSAADHAGGRWTQWLPDTVWHSALRSLTIRMEPLARNIDRAHQLPRAEIVPEIETLLRPFAHRSHLFGVMRFDALANARLECLARFEFLQHALAIDAGLPDPLPESLSKHPVRVDMAPGCVTVSTRLERGPPLAVTVGRRDGED